MAMQGWSGRARRFLGRGWFGTAKSYLSCTRIGLGQGRHYFVHCRNVRLSRGQSALQAVGRLRSVRLGQLMAATRRMCGASLLALGKAVAD